MSYGMRSPKPFKTHASTKMRQVLHFTSLGHLGLKILTPPNMVLDSGSPHVHEPEDRSRVREHSALLTKT